MLYGRIMLKSSSCIQVLGDHSDPMHINVIAKSAEINCCDTASQPGNETDGF